MKNSNTSRLGFTLIELLVVVLIIGILAAVALPQYQKAVEKSRAAEAWTVLNALMNAEKIKNMEEGTSTSTYPVQELALSFVDKNGNTVTGTSWNGKDFNYGIGGYISSAERNGGDTLYTLSVSVDGKRRCWDGTEDSSKGNCKKLGFSTASTGCISHDGNDSASGLFSTDCWVE